jgi:succinate dehydrogenase / fumarate reductase, membrane anchor subunit
MSLFGGLRPWIWQRLSALYMLFFAVGAGVGLVAAGPMDYTAWRALLATPWVSIAVALLFVAVFLHAWIGLRDIVLDYIHPPVLRALVLGFGLLALLVMALRVALALLALHT